MVTRAATTQDAWEIMHYMDEDDMSRATRYAQNPIEILLNAIDGSDYTFCGLEGGDEPIILGGAAPMADGIHAWMVTTKGWKRHRKWYARETQRQFGIMLDRYRELLTVEPAGHDKALRWLRWLGFEMTGPTEHVGEMVYLGRALA